MGGGRRESLAEAAPFPGGEGVRGHFGSACGVGGRRGRLTLRGEGEEEAVASLQCARRGGESARAAGRMGARGREGGASSGARALDGWRTGGASTWPAQPCPGEARASLGAADAAAFVCHIGPAAGVSRCPPLRSFKKKNLASHKRPFFNSAMLAPCGGDDRPLPRGARDVGRGPSETSRGESPGGASPFLARPCCR